MERETCGDSFPRIIRPASWMKTFPRVNFSSPGFGKNGLTYGSFVGMSPSGGLVTAVSGGKVLGLTVAAGNGAQETAKSTSIKTIRLFILPPRNIYVMTI
jgi:hypothetical protein